MKENKLKYKIQTDDGWKDFDGVRMSKSSSIVKLTLESNEILQCTFDHNIYFNEDECKPAIEYEVGDKVCSAIGYPKIISKEVVEDELEVYDILEVGDKNRFYANNVLVHNCQFIGQSNALVDTKTLRELLEETKKNHYNFVIDGDIRFYRDLDKHKKYVIGIDPSMGVGGDFAAIQVFEFPGLIQVAEWLSDNLNQNEQVEKVRTLIEWMYNDLKVKGCRNPEIYWSFENNAVGEGFLCSMREKAINQGLNNPQDYFKRGICISQIGNKRLGFTTDKRTKSMACAQLKNYLENKVMKIYSAEYAKQLSTFTLKNVNTYAAQGTDEHDDLISASLIVINVYVQSRGSLELDTDILTYEQELKRADIMDDIPFLYILN